ncbi:MAG: helix-turn-helix transcriptional regulator [Myxococcales bacterium]|nr:helix-turn-helix transcriptional regulator [Myxococcales bacterium]
MSRRRKPASEPIHWVRDPAQIEALASPLRQRILDRIEAAGPCSVAELAAALGRRADALYYHVRLLTGLGLLAEVGSRPTATSPEALFDLAHRRWHIAYEPASPRNAAALRKLTRQMLRQAAQDFEAGLADPEAKGQGPDRNLWSLRLEAHLDEDEQQALVEHLEAVVALLRKPKRDRRGRLIALTWVLAPIEDAGAESE